MTLFIGIGAAWVVGMVGYIAMSSKPNYKTKRCNVRRYVIQFKEVDQSISSAVRKK